MGKWTAAYYDDVLSAKFKSLVSGAIKRSKLEKTDPTISYESFVEELDAGDSFTTAIIDCLVKELADRRTRPSDDDRRLIGERTAKSLRMITTPFRLYFDRSTTSRRQARSRGPNLPAYLTSPPDEMDLEEDEDEFDNLLEPNATSAEGARINSEMYDAFTQSVPSSSASSSVLPFPRSSSPLQMNYAEESVGTVVPAFFPPTTTSNGSSAWSLPPSTVRSSGANLARQSSIRRPARSRTVDFNDFTSRRRSSIRDSLGSRSDRTDTAVHEGLSSRESNRDRESATRVYPSRRFFSAIPRHRREPGDINFWREVTEGDEGIPPGPSTVSHWVTVPRIGIVSTNDATETSDERTDGPPRLRRGGLRAPESILSRHVSPVIDSRGAPSPPSVLDPTDTARSSVEATAYPTPGSMENENHLD